MKHSIFIFFAIALTTLYGCNSNRASKSADVMSRDQYLATLDSASELRSRIFWTSDLAYSTGKELMLLLDTLYQHVRSDEFPQEIKKEERWMSNYRRQLCRYYDIHNIGSVTLSSFAKADSVLEEGLRLLKHDSHESTMEVTLYDAEYTFDRCREYGFLTQLIHCCEAEPDRMLI